jgi:hypothetical protein
MTVVVVDIYIATGLEDPAKMNELFMETVGRNMNTKEKIFFYHVVADKKRSAEKSLAFEVENKKKSQNLNPVASPTHSHPSIIPQTLGRREQNRYHRHRRRLSRRRSHRKNNAHKCRRRPRQKKGRRWEPWAALWGRKMPASPK